ncbi:MAG: UDP-glucose/GDP-mannose dehydrogenase family protein [Acidobacteria bacterium]|nr:UDP-glucose/GDP-mannose dehydrogenase family protein [Acidobacteriota bacterium]
MKVTVIGAGYVGCVSAACLARLGHDVTVVDLDPWKITEISAGRSPILEPGLDDLLSSMVRGGKLRALPPADEVLSAGDVAVVCVSTPSLLAGGVDTRPMQRAIRSLAKACATRSEPLVVTVRSTIAPEKLRQIIASSPPKLKFVVNPEFLRETTAIHDFEHPPFVLLGGDDPDVVATAAQLFAGIDAPAYKVDIETALLVKYASNAYHALKIAFANEIGAIAEAAGADPLAVMRIFAEDRILNISPAYLRPGFAFGGSCLPKDVRALVSLGREYSQPLPVMRGVIESNQQRIDRMADAIISSGAKNAAVLGLSFKKGTDDLRESPYLLLASKLDGAGIALRIFDPDVSPVRRVGANRTYATEILPDLPRLLTGSLEEALAGADSIVLCKRLLDHRPDVPVWDLEYLTRT